MTEAGSPAAAPEPGGFAPANEERVLKRSDEGRMVTGVCAGLGRYTGMDPVLFRVGFAILVVGSGIGIMLYLAAFLLMRNTNGGPGYVEQWSRRLFDTETVMALLAAVLAFGLIMNVAAGGISYATIVVGTLLAIALLAAHTRGVDLLTLTKSMPQRLRGRRGTRPVPEDWAGPKVAPPAFSPSPAAPFQDAPSAAEPGYRRLADLARDARSAPPTATPYASVPGTVNTSGTANPPGGLGTAGRPGTAGAGPEPMPTRRGGGFDSSGEPFAPRGPYAPSPPPAPYASHGWGHGTQATTGSVRSKKPRSLIGAITIFVAFVVGGIMVVTQSPSSSTLNMPSSTLNLPLVGGAVLITIGAGLLVATWFGRGAGLVAIGTILSLLLVAGTAVNGIPKKIGSYTWVPTDASVTRTYSVGIGDGTLDLRDTKLAPGSRTRFDASVSVGELKIIVPPTARVEVFGYARLGDVKIEHTVKGGADVRHDKVLEPEVAVSGGAPVLELHVKAGIGDVEVQRAA